MPISVPSASSPTITVYTKTAWADSWTEQPLMIAHQVVENAAPSHGTAKLSYRYGKTIQPAIGSRPADSSMTTISRPSFVGKYVKITISSIGDWYGVIQDGDDDRHGLLGGSVESGVFHYNAVGLTWFLDQVPILQSKVKNAAGSWLIDRTIPFNGGTDPDPKRKNRVAWKNYDSTLKCFTDRFLTTTPTAWKASNAAEYILDNFGPVNAAGSVLITFELDTDALTFLDYEIGRLSYDGMTPWQVLNKLIDRRRGLGWHTYISSGVVKIKVWSQTDTDITLPSGSVIPANPDTMTYDFDNAVNIKVAAVGTTLMSKFDQVIVRGERAGSVFSVRPQTNFEKDWTDTQKNAYNAAASLKTGYSSLSDDDKEAANMDFRAQDSLARVFSWWRPKTSWDGRSATDPASGTNQYALPKIDADGELVETGSASPPTYERANIQRSGLRILPYIPLRQGVDYTKPITADVDSDDDAEADFLPPMVFFKTTAIRTATGSLDAGWMHGERLNQSVDSNSSKRPYSYSVDIAVREDAPGLVLRTIGKPQHYIAQDLYTSNGSWENISSGEGLNHDQWIATVYILQDNYCKATYPLTDDLPSLDLIRPLKIDVEGAHLDYIAPGTIVAVEAGELKKTTQGGLLRDDRQKLKDIARLAFMWYGQDRRILDLSFKGITTGFSLGHLITEIGATGHEETINTCITSITYNLQDGTTRLQTQFGELDFTQ